MDDVFLLDKNYSPEEWSKKKARGALRCLIRKLGDISEKRKFHTDIDFTNSISGKHSLIIRFYLPLLGDFSAEELFTLQDSLESTVRYTFLRVQEVKGDKDSGK